MRSYGDGRYMTVKEAIERRRRFGAAWAGNMQDAWWHAQTHRDRVGPMYAEGVHANCHDRRYLHPWCLMPIDSNSGEPRPHYFPGHLYDVGDTDETWICQSPLLPDDVGLLNGIPVAMCDRCRGV